MSNIKDENGKFYYGWKVVIMGFVLMIFGYACIVSVSGVFTLPVTTDLGLQIGDWVVWMTISSLANIGALLVVQKLMTEKYLKTIMIIGCVLGAIGMVGFAFATKLWHFYAFSVLLGICMGLVSSTPCSVLANNWFGPKIRGLALSLIFGGTSLGCMAIMPILNQIVIHVSWKAAYLVRLNDYLADIKEQAQELFERIVEQMKQAQGITEQLKADDTLEWIGRMSDIQACAREIVNKEMIYQ